MYRIIRISANSTKPLYINFGILILTSVKKGNKKKIIQSFSVSTSSSKKCDVVIIGGGIIGLNIARKVAAENSSVVLIEKGEIGSGTSGHFHELLHSGARYAVHDPIAAKECYEANRALCDKNSIVKDAIVQTGGLFLALNDSDIAYSEELVTTCRKIGIPIDEIDISSVIAQEPRITKSIKRALHVPDGFIDGKKALHSNYTIAKEYGVDFLVHHEVIGFNKSQQNIESITVRNAKGNEQKISCNFVINATGAWAGRVGKLVDVDIPLLPYRGVMLDFQGLLCTRVINRCHKPANGDIFVPARTHTIFGTTATQTNELDNFEAKIAEVKLLLSEGEQLIPGLSKYPIVKKYAGVRPLYANSIEAFEGREISRSFAIINHKDADGINNFISVIGGKFTIYELMGDKAIQVMNSILLQADKSDSTTAKYDPQIF